MKFIRWGFVVGFSFSTLYHLTLAFFPKVGDVATGQRHLIFTLINIAAICLLGINHKRSLLLFIPLIIQQYYSHGMVLWNEWNTYQQIDWPSVVVLSTMPFLFFYVVKMNRDLLEKKLPAS